MALPLAREAFGGSADLGGRVAVRLAWEVGGAVAFGVVTGALFALYMRYVAREVTLVLFAACALLSQVGLSQDLQPLLAAVAAGVVIENLSPAQGLELRNAIRRGATPALLIFFVWVGTSLRLDLLVAGGAAAALLAGLRILLLRLGVGWGVAAVGEPEVSRYAWTGLVSQAGITLGFAATLASEFPDWGRQIYMLVVSTMAFNELIGPLLFRIGLGRAGEIDDGERELPLIVVSNREPYLHQHAAGGGVSVVPTTGGVAVALDALMRRRGGIWIAHGGGDADRAVVDADDKVIVPPDAPAYALKRLWIDELTFSAYYGGFANEGLWPLCHQVDVRPTFRAAEWLAYQQVNDQFAAAIDSEMPDPRTSVFIQDYHLALVAERLRRRQPQARTALFWHIPWPHPDRLRICPWDQQLVAGLLANDLLAFQVDRDRRNFLQAVEELPDTSVDRETSQVTRHGHRATVVTVPIGVDFDRIQTVAAAPGVVAEQRRLRQLFRLQGRIVGIGVDRLDYTKGIPERLDALAQALDRRPGLRQSLTFVQIGVPSRSELRDYAAVDSAIGERVQELNARYAAGRPPIVQYFRAPLELTSLIALYQLAHFCVVSSLHDGMNLVAKEFVAARQDEDGVLVLSSLTGAAQELKDALLINPYDTDGFAEAIIRAVDMPAAERAARMRAMRGVVAGRDVFLWASDILQGLDAMSRPAIYQSVPEWDQVAV
jgi:trehalose 6-phosphate synthase